MPLTAGGIATTAIFTFVACWNEFIFALALTVHNASTLPLAAMSFRTFYDIQWARAGAAAFIITIPVIIFAIFMQKYLVSGMTMGAIR
jgi:ABC-type glycerol-3-phosphate transport system permease component